MPTQKDQVHENLDQLEAELANAETHKRGLAPDERARLEQLRERASMVRDEVGKTPEKREDVQE